MVQQKNGCFPVRQVRHIFESQARELTARKRVSQIRNVAGRGGLLLAPSSSESRGRVGMGWDGMGWARLGLAGLGWAGMGRARSWACIASNTCGCVCGGAEHTQSGVHDREKIPKGTIAKRYRSRQPRFGQGQMHP